jgi:hypothetical protein
LENFQTELEENQVDYTIKPKPHNKDSKNDIHHGIRSYQEGNTSNNMKKKKKKNQTQQQKKKNTETNTTNTTRELVSLVA